MQFNSSFSVSRVQPDSDAYDLADRMATNREVQKTILDETLDAAEEGTIMESGRTACGGGARIKGPLARYPTSVSLATCPLSAGGAWHTHVTPDEIRNPENSIPDMANVVYGNLDVSIVTGTESIDVFVAASDRAEMIQEFQNALGAEVESVDDVTSALRDGTINNPVSARNRVRRKLSPLFERRTVGFSQQGTRANELVPMGGDVPMFAPSIDAHEAIAFGCSKCGSQTVRTPSLTALALYHATDEKKTEGVRESFDRCGREMQAASDSLGVDIRALVISQALGTIVGTMVERIVFDE